MRKLTSSFSFTRRLICARCIRPMLRSAPAVDVPGPGSFRKRFASPSRCLLLLLVIILMLSVPPSARAEKTPEIELTPEERAWLVKHPKIDVGIMNNWPPMNYVDEKGIPRGIGVDYLDVINTLLGDVFNIIPAPFKENYDAVKAKRLDALMDITPKPDREPFFNFTKPYLTIPQIIVGQKNTPYLNGEKDLYGKTVALEHGYYTITRFKRVHPEIKISEYNSTSDCLDAVARGEVDAYVGNRAVAIYLIEKELTGIEGAATDAADEEELKERLRGLGYLS